MLVCVCRGARRGLHLPRAFGGCLGAGGEMLGFITMLVCRKPLAVGFVSMVWAERTWGGSWCALPGSVCVWSLPNLLNNTNSSVSEAFGVSHPQLPTSPPLSNHVGFVSNIVCLYGRGSSREAIFSMPL